MHGASRSVYMFRHVGSGVAKAASSWVSHSALIGKITDHISGTSATWNLLDHDKRATEPLLGPNQNTVSTAPLTSRSLPCGLYPWSTMLSAQSHRVFPLSASSGGLGIRLPRMSSTSSGMSKVGDQGVKGSAAYADQTPEQKELIIEDARRRRRSTRMSKRNVPGLMLYLNKLFLPCRTSYRADVVASVSSEVTAFSLVTDPALFIPLASPLASISP